MSRWVNGSLEDLLMVSISARSHRPSSPLRAELELPAWGGEPPPPTLRTGDLASDIDVFLDELADDGLDLSLRLLVVDSIAAMLPREGDNLPFFAHVASVVALRDAIDDVCARVTDMRVARVVAPDAPLRAYLKGLVIRGTAMARALERLGFSALERAPDADAFARAARESSGFHLVELMDSTRRDLASLRIELGQRSSLVRGLRDSVERLFSCGARVDLAGAP